MMEHYPSSQPFPSLDEMMEQESTVDAIIPDAPILTDAVRDHIANPPFIQDTIRTIDAVDEYAWNRGVMGLDMGFDCLNKAFNGLNTGVIIIGGPSNSGKSALMLQTMKQVTNLNQFITEDHPKMAFSLYFSLDDSNNELMPRLVAIDQDIPINYVLFPKKFATVPSVLDKRNAGWDKLKRDARFFAMKDSNFGSSIEYIEATMRYYQQELETMAPGQYRLCVFIDNFYDITVDAQGYTEENARYDHVATCLDNISIEFDAPIVCSGEFRKINVTKRPQLDDLKSSGKITYRAKAIVLVYNEVGVKKDAANIYWEMADVRSPDQTIKMPILEMDISKNKYSSYKGREYARFMPDKATFYEATDEEKRIYQQMMKG